jgi:signal transduction histidine kinase
MNKGNTKRDPSADGSGGKQYAGGEVRLASSLGVLAASIFAIDLWLPSGVAGSVAYVTPVLLGWRYGARRLIVLSGVVATVLTATGFLLEPATGETWVALSNRVLALFAIWATVIMLVRGNGAEGALKLANERLESRVEARTAELRKTRTALVGAQRLAEMGRLTGTVAHELRNPLGVIVTSIAVIGARSSKADIGLEAALARAKRAIGRCENIITEHLDFARAKGHQPVPAVLDDWLTAVLNEMRLPEAIVLNRDLGGGGAVVHIDPESLRRALINLVDNACQAMSGKQGGTGATAEQLISVSSRMASGGVEIVVADNGPGIPGDILVRLPEPLLSTKAAGTGLGLPAVQRIMEDHAGSMLIESKPGQGTQVILRLPHANSD